MAHKEQYTPLASDEPVYEIDSFELFWEQHKAKIIGGVVLAAAVLVAVFGWLVYSSSQRSASEKAFSEAKTPADYRAVIDKYPSLPVAGDAALLLAGSLRSEKKYDDANKALDQFVKSQPEHPFAPLAKVAAAENLALSGKLAEAESALQAVAQTDGKSFAAPYALFVAAQLRTAQGQSDAALTAYRQLSKSFPTSVSTRASAPVEEALESMAAPAAAPAQPAP